MRRALAPRTTSWQAVLAVATLAAVLLAQATLGAGPASAHASLVGTDPPEGARVAETPRTVVLTFSEEVDPGFVTVNLRVGGGEPQQLETTSSGSEVSAAVSESIAESAAATSPEEGGPRAAEWQVDYRVVSTDGHPITGSVAFDVVAAAGDQSGAESATPSAEPATPSASPEVGDAMEASPVSEQARGDGRAWLPTVMIGVFVAAVVAVLVGWLVRGRRTDG